MKSQCDSACMYFRSFYGVFPQRKREEGKRLDICQRFNLKESSADRAFENVLKMWRILAFFKCMRMNKI